MLNLAGGWKELLNEEPVLEYVKGYEAFGLHDQFTGWNETERDKRLLKFVDLIARHSGKGIAFVIDNRPFELLLKELKDDEDNYFKNPAELAFAETLSFFLQSLPDFGENQVDIVFDCGLIERSSAQRAYQEILDKWSDLTNRLLRKEPHWEDDKNRTRTPHIGSRGQRNHSLFGFALAGR